MFLPIRDFCSQEQSFKSVVSFGCILFVWSIRECRWGKNLGFSPQSLATILPFPFFSLYVPCNQYKTKIYHSCHVGARNILFLYEDPFCRTGSLSIISQYGFFFKKTPVLTLVTRPSSDEWWARPEKSVVSALFHSAVCLKETRNCLISLITTMKE